MSVANVKRGEAERPEPTPRNAAIRPRSRFIQRFLRVRDRLVEECRLSDTAFGVTQRIDKHLGCDKNPTKFIDDLGSP